MKRNITPALLALALTGFTFRAGAESTKFDANPTGTWKLITGTNTAPPQTLKLKVEGGKLTGTLSRQAGYQLEQLPLEDAKLKGTEITFATHSYAVSYIKNVLQPTDTNKWSHSKFHGTISGSTINGKVDKESWIANTRRTLDFQAKRVN